MRRASDRTEEKSAVTDMLRRDAALGRIHQEIIEALSQSGLRFVPHEVYDADGQGGETRIWEVPSDALHSEVRDWAMSNALAPGYATVIADEALDD